MDRRKTNDFWAKALFSMNIFAWGLLIVILLVFHQAQPEFETIFDRFYHLNLRTYWDTQYLYYLIYTVIFGIFISLIGFILGIFRGRRKNDHKKALIVVGIISMILLWVCAAVI